MAGDEQLNLNEVLASGRPRRLRRLPALVSRAVRLAWRAAPREFAMTAATQVVGALALAGQVLVTQRLIAELLELEAGAAFGVVAPWLALLAVLAAIVSFTTMARLEQQFVMGELVGRHAMDQVLEVSTAVDLVAFDSPEFHNRLMRAHLNAGVRPYQMANGVMMVVSSALTMAGIGVALAFIEPLFLLALLLAYVPAWATTAKASRLTYEFSVEQTERDRQRQYLFGVLSRRQEAAEVRAFGLAGFLRGRHAQLSDERIEQLRTTAARRMRLGLTGSLVTSVLNAAALALLVWFISTGRLGLAEAGAAATAILLFAQRLNVLAQGAGSLYESSLFIDDFISFVDEMPSIEQTRPTAPAPAGFDTIRVDDVSFAYPGRPGLAVDGVSMEIRRGEVIALVGENGSGKTTLAKLLAGLYQPSGGSIRWDDVDVASVDPVSLAGNVAVIFQDYARFLLSARENIGLGRHERLGDEAAIREAAERASADGFLERLPQGFETQLGSEFWGGSDLSGGQWQRVALARAFFRDAPLLILDEPTAALDPRSEADLFDSIRALSQGRTVLLISHRFSTVRSADRIYVLESGKVIEHGSHDALMQAAGHYADLFTLQAKAYLD